MSTTTKVLLGIIIAIIVVALIGPILHGAWVLFKLAIFLIALVIVIGAIARHTIKKWEKEQES